MICFSHSFRCSVIRIQFQADGERLLFLLLCHADLLKVLLYFRRPACLLIRRFDFVQHRLCEFARVSVQEVLFGFQGANVRFCRLLPVCVRRLNRGRNSPHRVLRLGTGFLVRQYVGQRRFQLLQIVAQRTGGHPRFTRRLFNIDLLERRPDRLDFFVQLPYSISRGLPPGETLSVATARFYQKQPIFVKAQPTNISDISQLSEPSQKSAF